MASYAISIIINFGIGSLLGWLGAVAVRSAARALGCLVVILFVLIQILGYYDLIHWDWGAFLTQLRPLRGLAGEALESGWQVLTYNLPLAVGFLVGLVLGVRR